jgi:5-methyltetrahydrofolate--homocysteine methyltransferase
MTPTEFKALLASKPLLLDGGLGTLFIAMGLEQGRAPEAWNLEHPHRVAQAHSRYAEAGSDVIHTNTFGGSPPKLAASGLQGRCSAINAVAVDLARTASGGKTLIAGDVGPTGLLLPPMGNATEQQLEEAFVEQITALAEAGVDLISIETMFDLREASAALRAALRFPLGVMCSLTFEPRKRGVFTIMGDRLGPSLRALHEAGAGAVGFNCTVTSETMLDMLDREKAELQGLPLVAQPNAGQPLVTPLGIRYDASASTFAENLAGMVRRGARVVGGCCGTDDAFIRAARAAVDSMQRADG